MSFSFSGLRSPGMPLRSSVGEWVGRRGEETPSSSSLLVDMGLVLVGAHGGWLKNQETPRLLQDFFKESCFPSRLYMIKCARECVCEQQRNATASIVVSPLRAIRASLCIILDLNGGFVCVLYMNYGSQDVHKSQRRII